MRIIYFAVLALILHFTGCNSVDPPKKAFDIKFQSWREIAISANQFQMQNDLKLMQKQAASEFIKKHIKYCLPEADVTLDREFAFHTNRYQDEIINIQQWLCSLGIIEITFWQLTDSGKSLLRTLQNGIENVVKHDDEVFNKATLKQKWEDVILSEDELKKLYEISKNETFENIAQILFKAFYPTKLTAQDFRISVLASASAPDWRNKKGSLVLRKKLMAKEIWNHFVQSKPSDKIANAILELLRKAETTQQKNKLIMELEYDQWTADAEDALYCIAIDKKEQLTTRISALRVLFRRCDINKYYSLGIDIVNENTNTKERCVLFSKVFSLGNNFFNLKKENQKLIIETGFEILIKLKESDYRLGYGVASTLGRFVKTEFKPNQKDEKYKDNLNLNDLFSIDTVRNAIKWYEVNKNQILED